MVKRFLVPGDVDCQYSESCKKYSYEYCMICKNNKVAVEQKKKEKAKKNYFKMLW